MAGTRWLWVGAGTVIIGTCLAFRATHPVDTAVREAEFLIGLGRNEQAARQITALSERVSLQPETARDLAWKLAAAGQESAARHVLQTGWEVHPHDGLSAEALVALCVKSGDIPSARAVLQKVEERKIPLSPQGLDMAAGVWIGAGDFPAAETALEQLIEQDPHQAGAWLRLAGILNGQNRFAEASALLQRAVQYVPDHSALRLERARTLTWAALGEARQKAHPGDGSTDD